MTLDEALNYSLTVPWILEKCTDIDPWCVGVVPNTKIFFRYPDATIDSELEIIPFGSIDPILAQHIVNIHNNNIEQPWILLDNTIKLEILRNES